MHIMTAWQILGLTPTRDKRAINKAYAGRLRETRPDEDPEGFARLVKARACALAAASTPFFSEGEPEEEAPPVRDQPPAGSGVAGTDTPAETTAEPTDNTQPDADNTPPLRLPPRPGSPRRDRHGTA